MICKKCNKPMMAKIKANRVLIKDQKLTSEPLVIIKSKVSRTVQHECSCGAIIRKSEADYYAGKRKKGN